MENHNLIRCAGDGWAPWSIVCVHLATGESKEWIPIESNNPEVDHDWVCPECDTTLQESGSVDVDKLKAICIHCVRRLRETNDPKYKDE